MRSRIKVGTRPSPLAVRQAREIEAALGSRAFELVRIETRGDKDRLTPFSYIEGSDFFTREIEQALIRGEIDAAVHSAKDLEESVPAQLKVAAITASVSPYECLVSRGNRKLNELSWGARIGTSSTKRKEALLKYRSDFTIRDLRGNIEERIAQLDSGDFEAIIVAHAALVRLRREDRIAQIIPQEIIPSHPLQGCLAVEVRSDDEELLNLFSALNTHRRR